MLAYRVRIVQSYSSLTQLGAPFHSSPPLARFLVNCLKLSSSPQSHTPNSISCRHPPCLDTIAKTTTLVSPSHSPCSHILDASHRTNDLLLYLFRSDILHCPSSTSLHVFADRYVKSHRSITSFILASHCGPTRHHQMLPCVTRSSCKTSLDLPWHRLLAPLARGSDSSTSTQARRSTHSRKCSYAHSLH